MFTKSNHKWRRTETLNPETIIRDDDWSLLDATGDGIARLFNTSDDDLIGAWRWRVWLDHKMYEGSARNGTEVRETCERLLAKYQQAQMVRLPLRGAAEPAITYDLDP
jgi:hypothetical protein